LAEARERICEAAARAVTKFRSGQAAPPFRLEAPIRLAVEFMNTQQVDRAFLLPGSERPSATRLEFTAPDMVTAHRAFRAMALLARD
jgi:D-aminopeptidase